jgi:hypothetical protein
MGLNPHLVVDFVSLVDGVLCPFSSLTLQEDFPTINLIGNSFLGQGIILGLSN